ncbi:hypothetical protein A4A49_33804 [Nicotiana attenuata]|uniref:Uncharacterized protein n=1 Tax=Nicotiana attenuata TaxID=49451 RepID=A0A1J6JYU7_NICAT|nr:hypothetical protein A4A49_33804 [Nicotiana attenuata]
MLNERLSNNERSNDQSPRGVAWEGDVYSQVLGNDKSGYIRGLGLGPTPSLLWGSKSSLESIVAENSSNEVIRNLEKEITELKELNGKQNEEMCLMKQEVSWMRQVMYKIAPNELFMPHNVNGMPTEQVPDANSGHQPVPQARRMSTAAENAPSSPGTTLVL